MRASDDDANPQQEHGDISARPIYRVEGGRCGVPRGDFLAVEEPLEIQVGYTEKARGWRVHKSVSVTMRTPGQDAELAAGFLFTEGIVNDPAQIASVGRLPAHEERAAKRGDRENVIRVELRPEVAVDLARLERHFYTSSSCGVCGKTSIAALGLSARARATATAEDVIFPAEIIHALPAALRATQAVFDRTGGLHAAALFDARGALLARREDVGRHNAVDKLIGAQVLAGAEALAALGGRGLFVSGRASFELVQKALAAGIPLLAAVGAPSSLAVDLARTYGATLLGFVRDGRFNIYCGETRIGGLRRETMESAPTPLAA
ncbi:MAG: formate dehydrogenase accessory sulfurtransferase FdhD [Verrucomicrobia bacterium]|nr:formate dehydrogenase accessory sulfurtransferase FdhD [Verrucomicrobiota bacterium]